MSFESLTKSLESLMAASGLGATTGIENTVAKTPEQLEADEAAAAAAAADLAKSQTGAEGLGVAAPATTTIKLTLEDGSELEAFDGGEMLKSLGERLDATEGNVTQLLGQAVMLLGAQSGQIAELAKSFTEASVLVKEQGETITALRADIDALRNQPAGRKSVANPGNVDGGAPLIKSLNTGDDQKGMQPQEFLAKCLTLQKGGKMSLQEVAIAEAAIGSNVAVPDAIRSKVFSQ